MLQNLPRQESQLTWNNDNGKAMSRTIANAA